MSVGWAARLAIGLVVSVDAILLVVSKLDVPATVAQLTGHVTADPAGADGVSPRRDSVTVGGARTFPVRRATDLRGGLGACEFDGVVPFLPRRCFAAFGVPWTRVQEERAHRACHQALICLRGSVSTLPPWSGQASPASRRMPFSRRTRTTRSTTSVTIRHTCASLV